MMEGRSDLEESLDAINVDDPEDLARRGLSRVQLADDDDQEYLIDRDGNIYDLDGNHYGTADGYQDQEESDQ